MHVGSELFGSTGAVDRQSLGYSDYEFVVNHARLRVDGAVIDDRVTYMMNFEFAYDTHAGETAGTIAGDVLKDLKIGFHYIPLTGIYIGHFLPQFTFFAPRSIANLFFIDYPLMNQALDTVAMANGHEVALFPTTRQTGLEFGVESTYLNANAGVFNGRQYYPPVIPNGATTPVGDPGWADTNNGKDLYINLVGKPPVEGLQIFAGLWYGMPLDGFKIKKGVYTEQNASVVMIDAGVAYLAPFGLTLVGEFLDAMYNYNKKLPDGSGDRYPNIKTYMYQSASMSYYIMGGFNFGPLFEVPVELLVRYDFLDPDTLNNKTKRPSSMNDELSDISVGVNYYIHKINAMLYLNYIHHMEAFKNIPNVAGDNTQTGISNDEIKLQAQVAF